MLINIIMACFYRLHIHIRDIHITGHHLGVKLHIFYTFRL